MPGEQLNFTIIQPDVAWEDKARNLEMYERCIAQVKDKREIVVLPEMFSTGFSMAPERLAEPMGGETVQWMKQTAARYRCILTGSLIMEENGNYYNRLLWVQPDGKIGIYDKRHLFGYGEEDKHYTGGEKRLIVQAKGWRICVMICYDLRFPVWARNQGDEYDVLLYVANWPEKRRLAWKTLLQARAIENMCYVIGVNRVGTDAQNLLYAGESSVFGPTGELLWQQAYDPATHTVTLEKQILLDARSHFPFLKDADRFIIL